MCCGGWSITTKRLIPAVKEEHMQEGGGRRHVSFHRMRELDCMQPQVEWQTPRGTAAQAYA